ncbi:MAG: hypothetical protein DMD79_06250 [Candidatus Rokuibacteriota bacterium]|nr:MAG: hypothetical protein DMD79_06250 [Candidatus Rokubacteria bacterium]
MIGKDVPFALLNAIAEEPEDALRRGLGHLQAAELLYETSLFPDLEYTFKHALTHEVTYKSLLTSRRQTIHAAIARALEVQHANCLEQAYGSLAHHYSRTEEADKAVDYLGRFAEKAARGHAHREAVRALVQALEHVERLPLEAQDRRRLEITLHLVSSLILLGRFDEILKHLLPQQERLERLQDAALASHYYLLLSRTYSCLGDHERAAQSAQRAITEAQQSKDDVTLGKAYCLLGLEASLSGGALQGIRHAQQAVARLERTGDRTWLGTAHWVAGLNYALVGAFDLALEAEDQARIIGEATGDRRLQTYAAWAGGMIHAAMGEWALGIEACQRGLACSPDPLNTAIASGWHGYVQLESGDTTQAIPLLERSAQDLGEFKFGQFQGWFTVFLAEAHRTAGQLEKALELATRGLDIMAAARFDYGIGWAERVLGRIAQAREDPEGAATHLGTAFQRFASVEARYELGRTHLDLAALAYAQGARQGVTTHLNSARDLFTLLRVPRYVERTARLAVEFGVSLVESST